MTSDSTLTAQNNPRAYGSFTARFRALVTDGIVITLCFLALFLLTTIASRVPGSGRILVASTIAIVLLYEPILVSRFGGTIGHRRNNLRVVADSTGGNPGFFQAFARYIIKTLLGILSFVTMALTSRHQAVHDRVTRTTVQIRNLALSDPQEVMWERDDAPVMGFPSPSRRIFLIILYEVALTILVAIVESSFVSDACTLQQVCTPRDSAFDILGTIMWIAATAAVIIFGWRGHLYGARRRDSSDASSELSNKR